jgi:hypothetical protein
MCEIVILTDYEMHSVFYGKSGVTPGRRGDDRQQSPACFPPAPRYWHKPRSVPLGPRGLTSSPTSLVAPSMSTTVKRNIVP